MNQAFELTPEIRAILQHLLDGYMESVKKQRVEDYATLNQRAEKHGIVLLGDSITEGFPIHEMYRGPKPIYNRGIGGDTTRDILNRLAQTVYDLQPAHIFLLIGVNDLVVEGTVEEIANRIEQICLSIREKLPQTQISVLSVFPVNTTDHPKIQPTMLQNRNNESIQALNALIQPLSSRLGLPYIDVYPHLLDSEGQLNLAFTTEGLHLNAVGYEVVFSILKEYLAS